MLTSSWPVEIPKLANVHCPMWLDAQQQKVFRPFGDTETSSFLKFGFPVTKQIVVELPLLAAPGAIEKGRYERGSDSIIK